MTKKEVELKVKEMENMDLEELINLVHEMGNTFFGYDMEITIQRKLDKNDKKHPVYYRLIDWENDYEVSCYNLKDCYIELYQDLLEKIFKEELEEERNEEEERERKFQEKERMEIDRLYQC